ncbi:hypothetical protein QBC35DRAFT_212450 [Podospora australis]|uniref:Mid2 domain-containing protein n=1 Tax=Podospora australis TaxID=1536484 RepID=A0AAN7AI69_9PEZI|nr:hypothetical protein QBC35DRAFT_212450 [Podospora australis]
MAATPALTTVYNPPAGCGAKWTYISSYTSIGSDYVWVTSSRNSNLDCQPTQFETRLSVFSPGICYGNERIAAFTTTSGFGSGEATWIAYCCQSGFIYGGGESHCFSYIPSRTSVEQAQYSSRNFTTTASTGTFVSGVGAKHWPVTVRWQESDLSLFPSDISARLRATMEAHERGDTALLTTSSTSSFFSGYTTRTYTYPIPLQFVSETSTSGTASSTATQPTGGEGPPNGITTTPQGSSSLSPGAIAGIAIGAAITVIGAILITWCLVRMRRKGAGSGSGPHPDVALFNPHAAAEEKMKYGNGHVGIDGTAGGYYAVQTAPGPWELGEAPARMPELYADNSAALAAPPRGVSPGLSPGFAHHSLAPVTYGGSPPPPAATTSWGGPPPGHASYVPGGPRGGH